MQIDRLLLEGFRNYDSQQLTFDGSCNVIYGENAQGKTNLLEAIVYLSCGRSPVPTRTGSSSALTGTGLALWGIFRPGSGSLKRKFS